MHAGHLAYFQAAKKFGDHLTVSVTSDRHVNKGPGRPYFSAGQRAEMVKALGVVDEVIISDQPTAIMVIDQVRPDFYVKGPDYKDLTKDVTGEIYNEKEAVEAHGGQLVFTDEETYSSSTLINRFFQGWTEEQRQQIALINSQGGFAEIEKAIEALEKLRVLVIGEPILDVYRFVRPEGISSKSPSISARFEKEEKYDGGSLAIHNHLGSFCTAHILSDCLHNYPKKIRYISGSQRIFEVTEINERAWRTLDISKGIDRYARDYDVIVAADFGHGLFDGAVLEAVERVDKFVGLNVQTNSSNFGFNRYTKHTRFDYLCIDTREAQLAEHDRYSSQQVLINKVSDRCPKAMVSMTLGPNGSYLIADGWKEKMQFSPSFADNIVDATGAGDAYFAITTCLLASGCKRELIPFIGNVFAGLKTKIIGNKASVTKAQLLKACAGILA